MNAATHSPLSIPDHDLIECIGRGSYGEVWRARNVVGTERAVKIVRRDRFDSERPYEREFAGIQKFEPVSRSHDGVVDILHLGRARDDSHFYYVMELADALEPVARIQGAAISNPNSASPPTTLPKGSLTTDSPITDYFPKTLRAVLRARG